MAPAAEQLPASLGHGSKCRLTARELSALHSCKTLSQLIVGRHTLAQRSINRLAEEFPASDGVSLHRLRHHGRLHTVRQASTNQSVSPSCGTSSSSMLQTHSLGSLARHPHMTTASATLIDIPSGQTSACHPPGPNASTVPAPSSPKPDGNEALGYRPLLDECHHVSNVSST
jgi:hypothetical protein